ncbi:MAG: GNAT family N-acetyltransferase [Prolixibacteraceae bacterium]|nr:GNAT family N-acetyltransferase [Prolixibacteraceae bacterium]
MKYIKIRDNIKIRAAYPDDKKRVFDWLTKSNLTKEMMGPPNYPDSKIPSWKEFFIDYPDCYFNGKNPLKGQSFIIEAYGEDVGHLNHNEINGKNRETYLDIWLCDKKYTGKGIGTVALILMCEYLGEKYGCKRVLISPSKRNKNAIRAYEKAGFVMTDIQLDKSEMDYDDNVVFVKILKTM